VTFQNVLYRVSQRMDDIPGCPIGLLAEVCIQTEMAGLSMVILDLPAGVLFKQKTITVCIINIIIIT